MLPVPTPDLHREITKAWHLLKAARLDGSAALIGLHTRKLDKMLDELCARTSTLSEV